MYGLAAPKAVIEAAAALAELMFAPRPVTVIVLTPGRMARMARMVRMARTAHQSNSTELAGPDKETGRPLHGGCKQV